MNLSLQKERFNEIERILISRLFVTTSKQFRILCFISNYLSLMIAVIYKEFSDEIGNDDLKKFMKALFILLYINADFNKAIIKF